VLHAAGSSVDEFNVLESSITDMYVRAYMIGGRRRRQPASVPAGCCCCSSASVPPPSILQPPRPSPSQPPPAAAEDIDLSSLAYDLDLRDKYKCRQYPDHLVLYTQHEYTSTTAIKPVRSRPAGRARSRGALAGATGAMPVPCRPHSAHQRLGLSAAGSRGARWQPTGAEAPHGPLCCSPGHAGR
jgi:hypothetical protein